MFVELDAPSPEAALRQAIKSCEGWQLNYMPETEETHADAIQPEEGPVKPHTVAEISADGERPDDRDWRVGENNVLVEQ